MPETPERDPVTSQSLALYLLIASVLLIVTLGWALYNEFYGLRPWKSYQTEFARRYRTFLEKDIRVQEAEEKRVEGSAEYAALKQKLSDLSKQSEPEVKTLDAQSAAVEARMNAVLNTLTDARGYVGSQIYAIEHTSSASGKKSLEQSLNKYERGPFDLRLPSEEPGGPVKSEKFTFDELQDEFSRLTKKKGELLLQKAAVLKPVSDLQKQVDSYVKDHMTGLTVDSLQGLKAKTEDPDVKIIQINNEDAGIVDRCQTCHVGILEPAGMTRKDMGNDKIAGAFTAHPDMELLRIHDPQVFG